MPPGLGVPSQASFCWLVRLPRASGRPPSPAGVHARHSLLAPRVARLPAGTRGVWPRFQALRLSVGWSPAVAE
eukprot:6125324-Lingulodinium_polyedra.AAC.1